MAQKNILIIEDSPAQVKAIEGIVSSLGYSPCSYGSLPKGVEELLSEVEPAAVLLDLKLMDENGQSVGDGFQICKEIKSVSSSTPVIIVSSESLQDAVEWAKMQGADAYLQKPFIPDDLAKLLKEVCEV